MQIKVNKDSWSKESKQSLGYEFANKYYENIHYFCIKCGERSIFTAEEQKHAFEVEKRYIDQKRNLCQACYRNFNELKSSLRNYEAMWNLESDESKKHAAYLKQWLSAINEVPSYGKSKNVNMAEMLFNLINYNA